MKEKLKYEEVKRLTREQVLKAFESNNAERISDALWAATYYEPDWRWVQERCLQFLSSPELLVRLNAATCLGVLAVLRKVLVADKVKEALLKARRDKNLRPYAEDALADIKHIAKIVRHTKRSNALAGSRPRGSKP